MLLCAQGSKSSEQETQEPSLKMSVVTSAYFISKSVIFFSPWQKEEKKKKKVYTFPGSHDLILWPTCDSCDCHQPLRDLTGFLTGVPLKLKGMAYMLAAALLRCPVEALAVTLPFNGRAALLSEHGHTNRRLEKLFGCKSYKNSL